MHKRMMRVVTALGLVLASAPGVAWGQHSFEYTRTVDPSGNADHTTIQAAIDTITSNPPDRYTILIYAGTYTQNIELDDVQENIDLVGIDAQSVFIAPSTGDGVTITTGTESARHNALRNLTIRTTSGHGIVIERGTGQGDEQPRDITIDNVIIDATGTDKDGLYAPEVEELTVTNCDLTTADGHGINLFTPAEGENPSDVEIQSTSINAGGSAKHGVEVDDGDRITFRSCTITSELACGISLQTGSEHIDVLDSTIRGVVGIRVLGGDDVFVSNCQIIADDDATTSTLVVAIFFDRISGGGSSPPANIVAKDCDLTARADDTTPSMVAGVRTDTETFPRVLNCRISASSLSSPTYGVFAGEGNGLDPNVIVIGGSVTTLVDDGESSSTTDEKQTEVFDLRQSDPVGGTGYLYASGVAMSKWRGPILPAERSRSVVQRILDVAIADGDAILTTTLLITEEQPEVQPTGQPDVYRVLTATGGANAGQDVYIIGTDWAGNTITDKIELDGTNTVTGNKPFKTVDHIILPARTELLQTVRIGTAARLGLQSPIAATGNVLQLARMAANEDSYAVEASVGQVDENYGTVGLTITAGDSFEWTLEASD
jgi:Right handed beta helix region